MINDRLTSKWTGYLFLYYLFSLSLPLSLSLSHKTPFFFCISLCLATPLPKDRLTFKSELLFFFLLFLFRHLFLSLSLSLTHSISLYLSVSLATPLPNDQWSFNLQMNWSSIFANDVCKSLKVRPAQKHGTKKKSREKANFVQKKLEGTYCLE